MNTNTNMPKGLAGRIIVCAVLDSLLCITTYALFYATVSVDGHFFKTGTVSIDLNGGMPIIEEHEYLLEPGMTVEKPFYIQNLGTGGVYYKLYFDNVAGGLADVIEISVASGDKILYEGTANTLTRGGVLAADDMLSAGERRDLTIRFYYPDDGDNTTQNTELKFDLCAEAVQEKNNPDKVFE